MPVGGNARHVAAAPGGRGRGSVPAWTRQAARLLLLVAVIAGALWSANRPAYAVDVAVESAAQAESDWLQSAWGPVWTSANNAYVFYLNATAGLVYRKTTDGGATWGAATAVDTVAVYMELAIWYDKWTPGDSGTIIHIAAVDGATN